MSNAAGTPSAKDARAAASAAAASGTIRIGDLTVNRLGFGAMRITGPGAFGPPADPTEARRVLRRAVELGVNFIDTADSYGPELSERLIAEALYPYPPGLLIATKGGLVRPGASAWIPDGRPSHLRAACEGSLKRLRLERIELYQLHAPDARVPLEDSIGELARLRSEGKIRHVGVSNFTVGELTRAQRLVPIVSVQNRYNLSDRSSEGVLQRCERERLAFIPWSPLGRASAGESQALRAVARSHGLSVLQAALAWLLAKSAAMVPIPGTSSVVHLEENVAAAGIKLAPADLAALG